MLLHRCFLLSSQKENTASSRTACSQEFLARNDFSTCSMPASVLRTKWSSKVDSSIANTIVVNAFCNLDRKRVVSDDAVASLARANEPSTNPHRPLAKINQKKCFICQVLQLLPFNLLIDHFSSIAYRYNKTELFQLNSFLLRRPRTFFTQSSQLNSTGCLSIWAHNLLNTSAYFITFILLLSRLHLHKKFKNKRQRKINQ